MNMFYPSIYVGGIENKTFFRVNRSGRFDLKWKLKKKCFISKLVLVHSARIFLVMKI